MEKKLAAFSLSPFSFYFRRGQSDWIRASSRRKFTCLFFVFSFVVDRSVFSLPSRSSVQRDWTFSRSRRVFFFFVFFITESRKTKHISTVSNFDPMRWRCVCVLYTQTHTHRTNKRTNENVEQGGEEDEDEENEAERIKEREKERGRGGERKNTHTSTDWCRDVSSSFTLVWSISITTETEWVKERETDVIFSRDSFVVAIVLDRSWHLFGGRKFSLLPSLSFLSHRG